MLKKFIVLSLTLVLVLSTSLPIAFASKPSLKQDAVPTATKVKTLCSVERPSGVYPGSNGGVYVEDLETGDLFWCASGTATLLAAPPVSSAVYVGMAGVKTSQGLVLVLVSMAPPGIWFCTGATSTGCKSQSAFTQLPSGFCNAMTSGCSPYGVSLDKKLNIYYADPFNEVVVTCTKASGYQTCTTVENLAPYAPSGIFRDGSGNLWVSDLSCNGKVWENGVVKFTLGTALGAITMSTANPSKTNHLYVAVTARGCTGIAHIQDLTDGNSLPTPFSDNSMIFGLTTKLQFTGYDTQMVYKTTDKT